MMSVNKLFRALLICSKVFHYWTTINRKGDAHFFLKIIVVQWRHVCLVCTHFSQISVEFQLYTTDYVTRCEGKRLFQSSVEKHNTWNPEVETLALPVKLGGGKFWQCIQTLIIARMIPSSCSKRQANIQSFQMHARLSYHKHQIQQFEKQSQNKVYWWFGYNAVKSTYE